MSQYPELKEIITSFLNEVTEDNKLTEKEYEKIHKRLCSNDLLLLDFFNTFQTHLEEEILFQRDRLTPRRKKVVDNLLRGGEKSADSIGRRTNKVVK